MRKKLFVFDLDGTLVNTYKAIEKSINYTLGKWGYPSINYRQVKKNIGMGDKNFISKFFPAAQVEEALAVYRSHHKYSILTDSKLMPHVRGLLYFLKKMGKFTAIASNRPQEFTDRIVSKLKLGDYFDCVLCADTAGSLKPDPKIINILMERFGVKSRETVYVGDMVIDMETARRAGVSAIFIKGGSSSLEEVREYKNKVVISSLKEVSDLYE